jgi:hypothetical protein
MSAGDVEPFHVDGQWWNRVQGQPADHRLAPYGTKDRCYLRLRG